MRYSTVHVGKREPAWVGSEDQEHMIKTKIKTLAMKLRGNQMQSVTNKQTNKQQSMDWYRHKQAQNMNKTEKSVNLRKDEKVV